jgi:SNF2 family DNA or RNA helicase
MLTTYEVLISDVEELSNVGWLQVIVDEGHRIKNKSSKILEALQMINCNRRLLLTGTPVSGKNKRDTRSDRTEPAHAAVARVFTD